MTKAFRESPDDLPPLQSLSGRQRVTVDLATLDLPEPIPVKEEPDEIQQLADGLGRILAYLTQTRTLNGMGKRCWAMAYVLRPDLLDGQTLEDIGRQNGVTKQSIEHYVREFRMTFGYGTDSKE